MTTIRLENVSSRYGAPMGRRDSPSLETCVPRFVRLQRVRLDAGGYDSGGAYWGLRRPGESLFVAEDGDGNRQFVDACSRAQAALKLGIGAFALKQRQPGDRFAEYGLAILDGRAPMPEGETRESVIQWIQESGAAMGQETARVIYPSGHRSPRYPLHMARALAAELGEGHGVRA